MSNAYVIELLGGDLGPWPRMLASRYDGWFKVASGLDVADQADGNVESPVGWFAFLDLSTPELLNEVVDYVKEVDPHVDQDSLPEPGFYVTQTNSQGLIFVWEYETRDKADAEWGRLSDLYTDYCGALAEEDL